MRTICIRFHYKYIIQYVGKANAKSFTLPSMSLSSIFDCLFVQRQNELSQEEQKKNQEEAKKLRLQVNLAKPSKYSLSMMSRVRTQMGVSLTETSCLRQKIGQENSYRVRLAPAGFW